MLPVGAKVYLACHDDKAAEETVKELRKKTNNDKVFSMKCDLSSFKSIRDFVSAFKKS